MNMKVACSVCLGTILPGEKFITLSRIDPGRFTGTTYRHEECRYGKDLLDTSAIDTLFPERK